MDLPPSYEESMELESDLMSKSTASAPLLTPSNSVPSLDAVFHGLPNSVKFSDGRNDYSTPGSYTFYVRDTMDCLHIKGTVAKGTGNVSLENTTGDTFLNIETVESSNSNATSKFGVRHQNIDIGLIEVSRDSIVGLHNVLEDRSYVVSSISPGDISISRTQASPPICHIHIPNPNSLGTGFAGTLAFPPNPSITNVDQVLSISVAIAYMMSRRKKNELSGSAFWKICFVLLLLIVIIIVGAVFGLSWLKRQQCLSRIERNPSIYRGVEC